MKNSKRLLLVSGGLILINMLIPIILKGQPDFVEKNYSRRIYLKISSTLTAFSNHFDFSLGEWTVAILLLLLVTQFIFLMYNVFKKKYKSVLNLFLGIIIYLALIALFYQLLWGMNNYRRSIEENLGLSRETVTIEDLEDAYEYMVNKTNALNVEVNELVKNTPYKEMYSDSYILKHVSEGYKDLNKLYPIIAANDVQVKPLYCSKLFMKSGYTGIYLYLFGEANINIYMPTLSKPFTASHEIAHEKGFASEDEANFIGFMALSQHSDVFFRYSAYFSLMTYVGNSLYHSDKEAYLEIAAKRNEGVLSDIALNKRFWDENMDEQVSNIHNKINDAFLKANNQPDGILSYNRVTSLFIKAYKAGIIDELENSEK